MPARISPFIAIIDPTDNFSLITLKLTEKLAPLGYEVKDFSSVKSLTEAVDKIEYALPVLAIADSGSYLPSFEEGPFMFLKKRVPKARGIIFTTDMGRREWQRFIDTGFVESVKDIVKRGNEQAVDNLADVVDKKLKDLQIKSFVEGYNNILMKLPDNTDVNISKNIYKLVKEGINPALIDTLIDPETYKKGTRMIDVPAKIQPLTDRGMKNDNLYDKETHDILISGKFKKYVEKDSLNVVQRAFFTDLVRYRLNYLSKNKGMKKRLKAFFENNKFKSDSDAWKIYKKAYLDLIY